MKKKKVKSDDEKQLYKEIENMSLEEKELLSKLIKYYKTLDTDELVIELRYAIYVKNTQPANRRSFENLNLGSSKGGSVS